MQGDARPSVNRPVTGVAPFSRARLLKRLLGQVLVEGGFITREDLARALAEQARTGERLGEVLVRLGLVGAAELEAVLALQEHLASFEEAVRAAAGERERLGELLVEAGRIRREDLDEALAEQARTGRRLGEILVRRGLIGPAELQAVLAFQKYQGGELPAAERLRLGEVLVRLRYISREQLERVLDRQRLTGKRLGELLVESGLATPEAVAHGLRTQKRLVRAALAAAIALATAGTPRESPAAGAAEGRGAASAQVTVTATVAARAAARVTNRLPALVVTPADVERGYLEVPAASRLEVQSNSPQGYFLLFETDGGPIRAVAVRGLGRDVEIAPGTSLVRQPPVRGTQTFELSYRFLLARDASPGTYAWPVRIGASPL